MKMPDGNTVALRFKEMADALADRLYAQDKADFTQLEDVSALVPHDLAKPIHQLMLCKGCSADEFERARLAMEKALYLMWEDQ